MGEWLTQIENIILNFHKIYIDTYMNQYMIKSYN